MTKKLLLFNAILFPLLILIVLPTQAQNIDLAVSSVQVPVPRTVITADSILVAINNIGTEDVTDFDVFVEVERDDVVITSETFLVTETVLAANSFDFKPPFNFDFSTFGTYKVTATVSVAGDVNSANDEVASPGETFSLSVVSQLPICEGFESFRNEY